MGESDFICEEAKRDKAGYSISVCSNLTDAGDDSLVTSKFTKNKKTCYLSNSSS
jgi:hypothetical protein